MTLRPGTILQLTYVKDRLRPVEPGTFVEVGIGQGHVSSLLLQMGWRASDASWTRRLQLLLRRRIEKWRNAAGQVPFAGAHPPTIPLWLYGQVVLKWQIYLAGPASSDWAPRLEYVAGLLRSAWVWSTLVATLLGMSSWMLALLKPGLSYASPFTSLSFVLIVLASSFFFNEAITPSKLAGIALIAAALWSVASR